MSVLNNKIVVMSRSYTPTGTILAGQPVELDGTVAESGEAILGIALHDADTSAMDAVMVIGECELTAGAAIAAGAQIQVGTGGKVITLAAGVAIGRALTAAAADGDKIQAYVSAITV